MCGVCGEIRFAGGVVDPRAVRRMTAALEHRGPDGSGVVTCGRRAFGHRRLAVIDPSRRAAQPMIDADLGLGMVYTGAVYNHRELRGELESRGYRFVSASDTEVLLKGYHAWGEGFVERLDCEVAVMMKGALLTRGRFEQVRADPAVREAYLGKRH